MFRRVESVLAEEAAEGRPITTVVVMCAGNDLYPKADSKVRNGTAKLSTAATG